VEVDPLQRLIAESEIRNLVGRLAHLADDANTDEYLTLYTEDGSWGYENDPPFTGKDGLRRGATERIEGGIQGPGTGTRHINTTLAITVESQDEARSESYFLYLGTKESDHPEILRTGRYVDRFRRTPDGWKIVSRRIVTAVN
jgi:3-phenylpropionate/cinnamic acid dioxygenase small subunit